MRKKITKYDILLIVFIIIVSSFFIYYNGRIITYSDNNRAVIYSEDKFVGEYVLGSSYKNIFTIKTSKGYNTIKIEDGKIWVEDTDCPDKYCKSQGKISGDGQVIVCLPNRLIIKIESDKKNDKIDFIAP